MFYAVISIKEIDGCKIILPASFFKTEDKRGYELIAYYDKDGKKEVNSKISNKTLKEVLDFTIAAIQQRKKEQPIVEANIYDVFKNKDGKTLKHFKVY